MTSELRPSEDPLDRQLRDVPVPAELRARLTADIWADEEIDRRLADVSIPFGLKHRLRAVASTPHWRSRSMVAAAALFLIVSCWQIGTVLREFFGVAHQAPVARRPLDATIDRPEQPRIAPTENTNPIVAFRPYLPSPFEARSIRPIDALGDALARERRELAAMHARLTVRPTRGPDPFAMIATATAGGSLEGVRGAPLVRTELPDADPQPLIWRMPRGVDPLLGADERRFLLETGSFPFVRPRDFPTSSVPLVLQTTAFEVARQALAAGEAPPPDRMRTEEFLSAVDYRFAQPGADSPLRLSAYGAIAPWSPVPASRVPQNSGPNPAAANGGAGSPAGAGGNTAGGRPAEPAIPPEQIGRLLQLGVQARDLPLPKDQATHLTVGVDVSAGMHYAGRLGMVQRALRSVIGKMRSADRMTLVALGGSNPTIIEDAGRAEIDQLLAAVDWLSAAEEGNSASGRWTNFSHSTGGTLARSVIQTCRVAARRQPPKAVRRGVERPLFDRRVIVFTDSTTEFDPRGIRDARQLLSTEALKDVRLDVVDVTGENEDSEWEEFLVGRGGRLVRADSAERMRSALMEGLSGLNQLTASDVVLSVQFNPQAVVGYRLIGHEPTALAAVAPPKAAVDFNAGQAGSMLFELRLNGSRETTVATAVLKWLDPTDGTPHESVQVITRGMLSTPWDKAASQLEFAAVATATAAGLRNSPWGDHVAPSEALEWARHLDRARKGYDLKPWLAMLEQIQELQNKRGSGRGGR